MLERATGVGPWYVRLGAGVVALLVGAGALITGYWSQFAAGRPIPTVGEVSIFLPFFVMTLVAATIAFVRREKLPGLAIGGLAMAVAAPIVGWVVLTAAVAAVAVAVLLILAKFH
jgi:hypothetical protein